ncbi:chromate resistance protein ChrB domain-containing protein [Comamonas testosteroni]|uniref:chromate resistance protein ChrB domain-containing protein n=1 Tax=Comamonas testosteroni TaxID=285 RepID=UPI0002DB41DB|nr:chromate resistance protein ChrB domain-containing protein [Comamonas testosteroni]
MKWITRERPKIDRIACPWLIARFIDKEPEFLYVPASEVLNTARATGAIPYDIPNVELSHVGELCSFDAFMAKYGLDSPALRQLAEIVRGADTSRLDLTPQSAGLYALSLGLSHNFDDDDEMLKHGLVMYDALYTWCRSCQTETHRWPPTMTV